MANIFFERFAELCKSIGGTPNSVAKDLGISSGSITAWKNGTEPRHSTVSKIADYFDTTVDYLLGRTNDPENEDRFGLSVFNELQPRVTSKKAPAESGKRSVSDDDIKFALFGGDGEITDAMYDEVRRFAAFVKQREAEKKKE